MISPITVPAPLNTTSQYVVYGPECGSPSCAQVLTVTTTDSSTAPVAGTPAALPPSAVVEPAANFPVTATSARVPSVWHFAWGPVPRHRRDLVRRVFVHRLAVNRGLAHTASLPDDRITTSATQSTGFNIFGVQFGVTETETAIFWTHGSLVPSLVDDQESWPDGAPICEPGTGISVGPRFSGV